MTDMNMDLDELRDSIRKVLLADCNSSVVRAIADGDEAARNALWSKIGELGWLGISIDATYDGLGFGLSEMAVLFEELGRHLTPSPIVTTLLSARAVEAGGNEKQKSAWLPAIAAGKTSATVGLVQGKEPLSVVGEGAENHICGAFHHVLEADVVDIILVPVINEYENLSLAIVDRDAPGLSISSRPVVDATRRLCSVTLTDVSVPADRLIQISKRQLSDLFDVASLALACDSIGGASRILEETVEYMKVRYQFDRPIGSFQALKHRCASWRILLDSAEALTSEAAKFEDELSVWASRAKYYACDSYAAIAGDAIQLHGGIGFTWEHDCHLFFKRAKLNQSLFGSSSQHRDRISSLLMFDSQIDQVEMA